MSDQEALKIFARQPVSNVMIEMLESTTSAVIQIRPTKKNFNKVGDLLVAPTQEQVPLRKFITRLIQYSNVQTPTLMTSLVYLNRLRNALPGNAVGMETTRHRIFLASLILSAKSLNDSSPLNKHWTKYTDGLLNNREVNHAESELIGLLKWNLAVTRAELVTALQPFLAEIKEELQRKQQAECQTRSDYYRVSSFYATSNNSIASGSSSKSSIYTEHSTLSLRKYPASSYSVATSTPRTPLREKSASSLNVKAGNNKPDMVQEKDSVYGSSLTVPKLAYRRYV